MGSSVETLQNAASEQGGASTSEVGRERVCDEQGVSMQILRSLIYVKFEQE